MTEDQTRSPFSRPQPGDEAAERAERRSDEPAGAGSPSQPDRDSGAAAGAAREAGAAPGDRNRRASPDGGRRRRRNRRSRSRGALVEPGQQPVPPASSGEGTPSPALLAGGTETGAGEEATPSPTLPAGGTETGVGEEIPSRVVAAGGREEGAGEATPSPALPAEGRETSAGEEAAPSPALPAGGRETSSRDLYHAVWSTGLLNVLAIARRELGAFFVSPIGYVVAAVLVLPVSFLGYLARIGQGLPVTMDPIFGLIALLMVFFTPLYTMRLLAEERRAGTLEVLLTSPVRDWELVTGKWLGGFAFYLATIAFTVVYVALLSIYTPTHFPASILGLHLELPTVDYGRIFAGYVGVALVGAAWVALGLFASSLTSNQIIAAVLGVGFLLAFQYLFGTLATFLVSPYSDFFDYLNAGNHAGSFSAGRLVPKDALYFLTLTVGTLFLTARVLESRKWR